jgi:hypothetical protein
MKVDNPDKFNCASCGEPYDTAKEAAFCPFNLKKLIEAAQLAARVELGELRFSEQKNYSHWTGDVLFDDGSEDTLP